MSRFSVSQRNLAAFLARPRSPDEARPFGTIERYWNDPEFAAQLDAERAAEQARVNALIDEGMRRAREKRGAGL